MSYEIQLKYQVNLGLGGPQWTTLVHALVCETIGFEKSIAAVQKRGKKIELSFMKRNI